MRARYLGTDHWRDEDLAPGPVPDLHRKAQGISRIRVEMSDGLLQPRNDVGHQGHIGLCYEAVETSPRRTSIPPSHSHEIKISTLISLS
jgi:hypothetical protein